MYGKKSKGLKQTSVGTKNM